MNIPCIINHTQKKGIIIQFLGRNSLYGNSTNINAYTSVEAIVVLEDGSLGSYNVDTLTVDVQKIKTDLFNNEFLEHLNV